MYHIAICDDNKEYQLWMKNRIEESTEYEKDMVCRLFSSGLELLQSGVENYHLVILDVQMQGMDGLATAKAIREKNGDAVLAFCSGAVMPQPEHFEVQAYRYMLKQFDTEKMAQCISELLQEMKQRDYNSMIEIVSDGRVWRLRTADILYVSRTKRGSMLLVEKKDHAGKPSYEEVPSNEKLEEWYPQLALKGFEFAHNSYMINLRQIVGVMKDEMIMSNQERLTVSRTYRQKFHERLSHYFSKKYRRSQE